MWFASVTGTSPGRVRRLVPARRDQSRPWTLITPNVVMLTALVVWTLGALTLYLVYCRHGEPSAPHSRVSPAPAGEGGLRVESWTPVRGDRWVARLTRLYGRIIDVVGSSGPWRAARALCS